MENKTWGGKRQGAGRKPTFKPKQNAWIIIDPPNGDAVVGQVVEIDEKGFTIKSGEGDCVVRFPDAGEMKVSL